MFNIKDYMMSGQAADYLGVSQNTLRIWDKKRKLIPYRHPINGYRLYLIEDLNKLLGEIIKENND